MALSPIYYARGDSNNANNAELNVRAQSQFPVTQIRFTSGTSGDLILDFVPDNADADTLPQADPDTQVIINGQTYNFAFVKSGTLDPARVPAALANDPVYVIKVDFNGDGNFDNDADNQMFFTTSADGTPTNMGDIQNGALRIGNLDLTPPADPVCFCAGTEISTPSGPRRVEALVAGDWVTTATGDVRQVMWVGASRIKRETLAAHPGLRPIVIPAHAFGPGAPGADLHVSPQHRVQIAHAACELLFGTFEVLVPAKFLLGSFAERQDPVADVIYFHILLADHDMLISNGLATESFQPARRTMDVMAAPARDMLERVIATLGAREMLTRKDRHRSLRQPEAKVLLHVLAQPRVPAFDARFRDLPKHW